MTRERLFYNPNFKGVWMIKINDKDVTSLVNKGDLVVLYHQSEIVGYNLLNMSELNNGFNYFNQDNLDLINEVLKSHNYQKIEYVENPTVVGLIIEKTDIKGKGFLCTVDISDKTIQIVTKATNMNVGDKVVCALPNSVMANGDLVSHGKVYGHLSEGMFGSKKSLLNKNEDIGDIMILMKDAEIGSKEWETKIYSKR